MNRFPLFSEMGKSQRDENTPPKRSTIPPWLSYKESACNVGDVGSIPGPGRCPREGHGNQLQYSCLENPLDRGAWWATAHRAIESWTQLSMNTPHYLC